MLFTFPLLFLQPLNISLVPLTYHVVQMSTPSKTALEYFHNAAADYEAGTGGCTRDVARYIVDICPPYDSTSVILDNACGTGIVTQEILRKGSGSPNASFTIACVDGVPAMVDLARHTDYASNPSAKVSFDVMSGEDLSFPDNHFTHSFTNMGILFFKDGLKGAKEIYRTLKPGGTAIVTSWEDLGYIRIIHQTQKAINPDEPLMKVPILDQWYQATHLMETLREAGFGDVQVHTRTVYYGAESVGKLSDFLMKMLAPWVAGRTDNENTEFKRELQVNLEKAVLKFERPSISGSPGDVEQLVGIPMIALVAVARK
jgi:ubiquinone/menaquinone biosynthesis C-methylase UbiE